MKRSTAHPRLTLSISPQAMTMLQKLVPYGLYGRNVAAVAREFLYAGLRKHVVDRGQAGRTKETPK